MEWEGGGVWRSTPIESWGLSVVYVEWSGMNSFCGD